MFTGTGRSLSSTIVETTFGNRSFGDVLVMIAEGKVEQVRMLIKNGSMNVNHVLSSSHRRNTLLHEAIENRDPEMAKMLIELGASLTIENARGETPADLIARCGMRSIVMAMNDGKVLLKKDLDHVTKKVEEFDKKTKLLEAANTELNIRLQNVANEQKRKITSLEGELTEERAKNRRLEGQLSVMRTDLDEAKRELLHTTRELVNTTRDLATVKKSEDDAIDALLKKGKKK